MKTLFLILPVFLIGCASTYIKDGHVYQRVVDDSCITVEGEDVKDCDSPDKNLGATKLITMPITEGPYKDQRAWVYQCIGEECARQIEKLMPMVSDWHGYALKIEVPPDTN